MGTWGMGIWQNDTALDVKMFVEELIAQHGKDRAFEMTHRKLDRELEYVDGVFAYAATLIELYGKINSLVAEYLDGCIDQELNEPNDELIDEYLEEREQVVREFAKKVEPYLVKYFKETDQERHAWYD